MLRRWEKQRLALQSKIESVLSKKRSDEVAIERFTIDWQNAGIKLYSSVSEPAPPHRLKKEIDQATRECQPEVAELAEVIDRSIKEQEALYNAALNKRHAPKWPKCCIEANRALAGMRN